MPGSLAETALKPLKVADSGWGQFVYARQKICIVLYELLKKSASRQKLKLKKRDIGRKTQEGIVE